MLAATKPKPILWAQPKNRPVSGALRQQHRRSPHEARGRSAKRINTKTRAEGRRNQAQGTLFFGCVFVAFAKGRVVPRPRTWTSNRNLTCTPPCRPLMWLPLIYLRPSTTSLCVRGCVTDDFLVCARPTTSLCVRGCVTAAPGQRQSARYTAPLFYDQTPTCICIKWQSPTTYRTKNLRPCRTWKPSSYDWLPSDVIYYFPQLTYKARLRIPPHILTLNPLFVQIGTTKGTGGDVLILEEAAYCDEGFFYETVAPILSVGTASLVAISTLTSEINFYTRLIKMRDPSTGRPLFTTRCIELVCEKCKEDGKSQDCVRPPPRPPCPTRPRFRPPPPPLPRAQPLPLSLPLPPPPPPRSPAARRARRACRPGAASAPAAPGAPRPSASAASPASRNARCTFTLLSPPQSHQR